MATTVYHTLEWTLDHSGDGRLRQQLIVENEVRTNEKIIIVLKKLMTIPVDSQKMFYMLFMFACFFYVLSIFLECAFSENTKNLGDIFVNAPRIQMAITSLICFWLGVKKN